MLKSINDLPDDVLLVLFENYFSVADLIRIRTVCRRFRELLFNQFQWKFILLRHTSLPISTLKTNSICPILQNIENPRPILSNSFGIPQNFQFDVLSHDGNLFNEKDRRPSLNSTSDADCSKKDCDVHRLIYDNQRISLLSKNWRNKRINHKSTIVEFSKRAETSFIQYDEHDHHLWFNHRSYLKCFNLKTSSIVHSYNLAEDDVLCYKAFANEIVGVANGNQIRIISLESDNIVLCPVETDQGTTHGENGDIFSLDIFSNDHQRYLIVTGSRSHIVSLRTFDRSNLQNESVWCTRVDDRVYSTRFSVDINHFLVGTGARASLYPIILFDVERPQPLHVFDGKYRKGAGVRCIEWVSENVFLASGFDAQFKEFDLRTGQCHYTFEDDHDNDFFSMFIPTNGTEWSNSVILGGNRHSTIRLVNRRQRRTESLFYVSNQRSPVHSLTATPEYLFASLDSSIELLSFTSDQTALKPNKLKI